MDESARDKMKKSLEDCNKELEAIVSSLTSGDLEKVQFSKRQYPNIFNVYTVHRGLCDLMCNYFTLINASSTIQNKDQLMDNFKIVSENRAIFDYNNMENLSKTHILSLVSFIELITFLFFSWIPNSIFKSSEEKQLRLPDNGLNQKLMHDKLDSLAIGASVKFCTFGTKYGIPTTGHSMLISKVWKDEYMFFNPDKYNPQCNFYNTEQLIANLDSICINRGHYNSHRIAFIDNKKFLERVETQLFGNHIAMERERENTNSSAPPR